MVVPAVKYASTMGVGVVGGQGGLKGQQRERCPRVTVP
jgi:hypothetical protein